MPDYIMRWLASRFLDADDQEELGILTPEVRRRKEAQDLGLSYASSTTGDGATPSATGPAAVTTAPSEPQAPGRLHRHAAHRPGRPRQAAQALGASSSARPAGSAAG
jgi:ribonucleoside-diphosphate reductase alpha chain